MRLKKAKLTLTVIDKFIKMNYLKTSVNYNRYYTL